MGGVPVNIIFNMTNLYDMSPIGSTNYHILKKMLRNLPDYKDASIYEIAAMTDTSRTTVWRLVQALGYNSFSEFRYALSNAVSKYDLYNRTDFGAAEKDVNKTIRKITDRLQNSITRINEINITLLEEIVDLFHEADQVSFYWMDKNIYLDALKQNLAMSGKDTTFRMLLPEMIADAETLSENSVVLIYTMEHTEVLDMDPLFDILKEKKCKLIIKASEKSHYERYADILLDDVYNRNNMSLIDIYLVLGLLNEMYRGKYL